MGAVRLPKILVLTIDETLSAQVMHRQSLACRGGDSGMGHSERCAYGLLTNPTAAGVFAPTPDYWTTLLYKRLMGPRILNTGGGLVF